MATIIIKGKATQTHGDLPSIGTTAPPFNLTRAQEPDYAAALAALGGLA